MSLFALQLEPCTAPDAAAATAAAMRPGSMTWTGGGAGDGSDDDDEAAVRPYTSTVDVDAIKVTY
jgi:hypothetical protein